MREACNIHSAANKMMMSMKKRNTSLAITHPGVATTMAISQEVDMTTIIGIIV
jgi:hypothetical protein